MKRRTLLQTGVATGAIALAGCLASGGSAPGKGNGTDDGNTTDGNATGDGPAAGAAPTLGEPSFEVVESGCGTQRSAVSITTDEAAGEVVVEGTIAARSACYTAALEGAVYGAETDSVWVDVVTEERPDAAVCAQCITEIRYRVTLPFEGGLPERVAVTHDGSLACPDDGPAADGGRSPGGGNATGGGNVTVGGNATGGSDDDGTA